MTPVELASGFRDARRELVLTLAARGPAPHHIAALLLIAEAPGASVGHVAAGLRTRSKSVAHRATRALERRKWITREAHEANGRLVRLKPTAKGLAELRRLGLLPPGRGT